jgi:purine-binding chemotaxis protein CheW
VSPSASAYNYLLCGIGASVCALPLAQVGETLRPLPIEPLVGLPAFVRGVAIIRGSATPVLDASRLIGAQLQSESERFVTLKLGARVAALAVGSVLGVRALPRAEQELPPLLREVADEAVRALGRLDGQLLWVLEGARLVPDGVWQAVEAHAATHAPRLDPQGYASEHDGPRRRV